MKYKLNVVGGANRCSTKPKLDLLPEFYAMKFPKKHFENVCPKLTLIDVFGTCRVVTTVSNCNSITE